MAIKGEKHGARLSDTLKPGEHLCFSCPIDEDCNEKDKQCLWRRYHRTKKMITKWCEGMEVA